MIERRSLDSLGGANHGWLDAKHHFSFAEYHDPRRMHWGSLRVWNDDAIQPGSGFPPHSHGDMEIITYVRQGAITHEDNLGNKGRTPAGDVQVMSAGSGITHAEYNLEPGVTRIFQIWIIPDRQGEKPSWGSQAFPKGDRAGEFVTLASGMAGDHDVLPLRTDARVLGATIPAGDSVEYHFAHADRYGYLVLATGAATVNGVDLRQQDGAAIHGETRIRITASEDSEVVLVDAAPLP
ncbi:pirin family protein [Comamonas sp. 17RB]|uniref:pirin family protein n=1 Tax=Comamonas sp. 17RB TaxID=3047025 RepID=UPI0024B7747E|nr:pirin family protein [Comamonas sp. 17RB]MDI9855756.1 pirin family protein [Comamonas sp. 17RB]